MKLFGKNQKQFDSLVQTVHTFSQDIGMQFRMKRCAVVICEKGKVPRAGGIKIPDDQEMKDIDEN